ncbi:hypothetical protein V2J09_001861 [Rumex salicifolius]
MADKNQAEDRETTAPANGPTRAAQPYGQQLRAVSVSSSTGVTSSTRRAKLRNHSLDEDRISKSIDSYESSNSESNQSGAADAAEPPSAEDSRGALPEFLAGGGTGIFKPPTRSAVHPNRPPALELRPHPLRETQSGKFLRVIACTETQLWAGQESGVRFWDYREMFEPGTGLIGGRVRRGDEDAAPFHESGNTSPTLCLLVDEGNKLIWTGHKDGKIRSWKMDQSFSLEDYSPFKEGLSWQGHKGPILSMAISSYGDLWIGLEGGVIKVWPWDAIEKSLSLSPEEKHMAALLVERSYLDLRSQVTVNGVCSISSSDIKSIHCDCARSKDLIRVFNVEGQIENRVDMQQSTQEPNVEDDAKAKLSSTSKKEKSQGFLQRSRNAIMGAADAVRRVATRGTGAFNEDVKKTECMVMTPDGMIWTGCSNGMLVQWDGNANRLNDFNHHCSPVLCFCTYGSRLWVGYASGLLQLLDLEGNLLTEWVSHSSPVVKMAVGGGFVFSLATHGGIRAWHLSSPGPLDNILRTGLASKELMYTRRESLKILVGTWNVGQGKASGDALKSWLGSVASDVGIVVVGLQEVEMGAGFLAMSAAKETVGLEGSALGQWWQDAIGKTLDEGPVFERVGSRQLAALLITIWVRKSLRTHVGDLDVAAVACGLGRTIGNKGGVGLRLRVYDRIFCFVNCHLAAHLEAVNRRNADFDHIFRTMVFSRQSNLLNVPSAATSTSNQGTRNTNAGYSGNPEEAGRPDLPDADMVIFLGDFNYRLFGITYDEARDLVSQRSFDWLREKDQLRAEMKAGKVFQGMRYDSGEKKRIPAWCDRIIYRDNRSSPTVPDCSLDCPVVTAIQLYEACMDVTESDHKPVRCKLSVRSAHVDRSIRRKEFGDIMKTDKIKALVQELSHIPEIVVSCENITIHNQETTTLLLTNKSTKSMAFVHIVCEVQSIVNEDGETLNARTRGSFGLPAWIEVTPAVGTIQPEQSTEITVRHTDIQTLGDIVEGISSNWSQEEPKDKEVILRIYVRGSMSTESRIHQVRVRLSGSTPTSSVRADSRTSGSTRRGQSQSSSVHRTAERHDNNHDMIGRG